MHLVSQDQKIEIRNGSEFLYSAGDIVEESKTIAVFDPFSDPIIAEKSGTIKY